MRNRHQPNRVGKTIPGGLAIALLVSAGVLLGTPVGADACPMPLPIRVDPPASINKASDGRLKVEISYRRQYYAFRAGNYRLRKITVFTRNRRFAEFVKRHYRGEVWRSIKAAAQTRTCADLLRRLHVVEGTLARALVRTYLRQTKRRVATPDVMLDSSVPYQPRCQP